MGTISKYLPGFSWTNSRKLEWSIINTKDLYDYTNKNTSWTNSWFNTTCSNTLFSKNTNSFSFLDLKKSNLDSKFVLDYYWRWSSTNSTSSSFTSIISSPISSFKYCNTRLLKTNRKSIIMASTTWNVSKEYCSPMDTYKYKYKWWCTCLFCWWW